MKRFTTILILVLSLVNQVFSAVDAPDLRCVSVLDDNNIQITWIPPVDLNGEFVEYQLFFSNNQAGPFTSISINGLATNQYTHNVISGANPIFYYMETVFNDGAGNQNSNASNLAQSIFPQFGAVSDSTAVVNWNRVFDPNIASSAPNYQVERKFASTNNWATVASPNFGVESFSDAFKFCSDTVYYRIRISDNLGCFSQSVILKDLFEDNTPPVTPKLDSVTVLPNGNAYVQWRPSSSQDTRGYIVLYYHKGSAQWTYRDTLLGINNTGYEEMDVTIDPSSEFLEFTVAAFDTCKVPRTNISPGAPEQQTVHLRLIPNNCERTVQLTWNKYVNWDDLSGYQVLVSADSGVFDTAFVGGVNDTSFVFARPDGLTVYCFKIQAISASGKTSTSNLACSDASNILIPDQQYFKRITVQDNSRILVETLSDTSLPIIRYDLHRSVYPDFGFFKVAETPFYLDSHQVYFDDFNALVNQNAYYYRVALIDSCEETVYTSPSHSSIFLTGRVTQDSLYAHLEWNKYTTWDTAGSGVLHYRILSVNDGLKTLIDSVSPDQTSFIYHLEQDIELGANLCFEIEAIEDSGNVYGFSDMVRSNQVCFSKNTRILVPNAFRPSGLNSVFKPVITFGNVIDYELVVYNRWGQEVFQTTNIDVGWDGKLNGQFAPIGAYVYFIRIKNFAGSYKEQTGTFVLLN